ncbi:MAG: hypothetical protein TREMPRED_000669 [Tremellales sp. Tagirdzhanova-0007]|nr:MAG: hypothetical protein TREMPRED_000669 [Tremellales sp. Tagirdzhanova-0007]
MVKLRVLIAMELEGVTEIQPADDDFEYFFNKEHSASFISPSSSSKSTNHLPYTDTNAQYTPLVALDCRGLEFTGFQFRGRWRCRGEESGTEFEIDLDQEDGGEEGRWDDYDEKAQCPVGISELRAKVERA